MTLRMQCVFSAQKISANLLSIYEVVADRCDELAQQIPGQPFFKQGEIHCGNE